MVRVIQITNEEVGSVTDIDLQPYVPGHIARLVTCIVRVNQPDQSLAWGGSVHEGNLWGGSDHGGDLWVGSAAPGDGWVGSLHDTAGWVGSMIPDSLMISQVVAGSEPDWTPVGSAADHIPTGSEPDWDPTGSEPDWAPVGSNANVIGPTVREHWIYNNGFVDVTDANSAPGVNSATLVGPLTLRLGDDLGSADILQLTVLLLGEAAGVFY